MMMFLVVAYNFILLKLDNFSYSKEELLTFQRFNTYQQVAHYNNIKS